MKKKDIEHIHRSRFLATEQKILLQISNIVRSLNLKYPEIANHIEISQEGFYKSFPIQNLGNSRFISTTFLHGISRSDKINMTC